MDKTNIGEIVMKELEIKNKKYIASDELNNLAEQVIKEKSIELNNTRIAYLLVYPNINKTIGGRCTRANNLLKFYGDVDYVIELSGEFYDKLDDGRKRILLWHELLHVLPVHDEKKGEWEFKLRKHDIEDFYSIIKEHGIEWHSKLKTMFGSVYDLDPEELDNFTL